MTPCVDGRQFHLGRCVLALRVRGDSGTAGPGDGGIQRGPPLVDVDRVHLGEQLARLDLITDIDHHPQHAAGRSGPDQIGASRLDRADPEEGGRDACGFRLVDRDMGGCQRARTHDHEDQRSEQQDAEQAQAETAEQRAIDLHGASQMPRR